MMVFERMRAVEAHYRNAGYAEASITPHTDNHDDLTCTVTLRVVRGRQRDFGSVEVLGVVVSTKIPKDGRVDATFVISAR